MLSAFLIYCVLLSSPSNEILSVQINEGKSGSIPKFANTEQEVQFKKSYWAKIVIDLKDKGDYVLSGGKKYLRNMDFFDEQGNLIGSGNNVELELYEGRNTIYIFYPFLDPKEELIVSIELTPSAEFYKLAQKNQMTKTGFLVIVFFLFILSLAFYIVSRRTEIIYLNYALYLFSVYYFFAYQYGFFGYFFDWVNHIHPSLIWITSASITITYTLFIQSFLHLKQSDRLLWKVLNGGIGFVFFVVLVESISFAIDYDIQHSFFFTLFSLSVQLSLMLFSLYRIYKLKSTLSRIALLGASILVSTTLFGQLASTLKLVDQTNYFIMSALTLEIFIFNIGIGIRMFLMSKERAKAQSNLINQLKINEKIQLDQQVELEKAVKERTEELGQRNKQNELLLSEIHHRVKNNLQTISSLLSIQQRKLKDDVSKQVIADSKSRVIAMGLIHEHLYKNASYAQIDFSGYLQELVRNLVETYSKPGVYIDLVIEFPKLKLGVENAILLGLIVNELVNNSIKHAFNKVEHPRLHVSMRQDASHTILSIQDNGIELIDDLDFSGSFGWKIIKSLCDKLKASLSISQIDGLLVEVNLDSAFIGLE